MPEILYLTKGKDRIKVTILDDGRCKCETDQISPANHTDAEHLFEHLNEKLGPAVVTHTKPGHVHTHTHNGITHSH